MQVKLTFEKSGLIKWLDDINNSINKRKKEVLKLLILSMTLKRVSFRIIYTQNYNIEKLKFL